MKNKFTEDDASAMITESREACKCLLKVVMIRKTVATYRLEELRHLRAVEKFATWRRSYGFDRCNARDKQWCHGSLPHTPERTPASMWENLNALRNAISMSVKDRSRLRVKRFMKDLRQGTMSLTDEEFPRVKCMIVERRGRDEADVNFASIDTTQSCSPRSRSSETSLGARDYIEENTERGMDLEPGELEQSSAGTSQVEQ